MVKVGLPIQRRPSSRPTDHMAHAHTERYRRWQQLGPKPQDKNSSRKVQVQSSSRQLQKPSSKNMQQTNMLWSSAAGYFMWHCHPSDPFAALSSDHRCTLVQVTYNHIQDTYNTLQNHLKNRAVKTVDKLNCRTMTTEKLLQQSPMSPHVSNCMQVTSN